MTITDAILHAHEIKAATIILLAPAMLAYAMWKSGTSPKMLFRIITGR